MFRDHERQFAPHDARTQRQHVNIIVQAG
jgi:hypothetical protein